MEHVSARASANADTKAPVLVIGAGPAGVAAAYELAKRGRSVLCVEATTQVGGLSRTVERDGYRFDIGPHRFFTKNDEVAALWQEMLGADFIEVERLTRIFYRGTFFQYPIRPFDTLRKLGLIESTRIGCSYLWRQLFPERDPQNFEAWTTNQFGARLFHHFFRGYTEKVWGIPCANISADWGAQRIKGLSLLTTRSVRNSLTTTKNGHPFLVTTMLPRWFCRWCWPRWSWS